jgi:hypothetical protein
MPSKSINTRNSFCYVSEEFISQRQNHIPKKHMNFILIVRQVVRTSCGHSLCMLYCVFKISDRLANWVSSNVICCSDDMERVKTLLNNYYLFKNINGIIAMSKLIVQG